MVTYAQLVPGQEPLDALAQFIAELNCVEEHHIGYLGTDPREIAAALQDTSIPPHQAFVLAHDGDAIVGAFGFEADTELGRAWLYGPLVRHPDWAGVADRLWAAVQPLIPAGAHEHELFCTVQNANCCAFATRHGFAQRSEDAILQFDRRSLAALPAADAPELSPADHAAFEQLHDGLFPGTYYAGRQIVGRIEEHRKVFVATEGAALQGYVYVEVQPEFGEGNIEFIGVAEGARGRGVGRRLLVAALRWMFAFERVESIALSVNATNTAALALYRSAGFQLLHTMRSFRSTPHTSGFSMLNSSFSILGEMAMQRPETPTGVLLMAYGTPETLDDVEPYYTHIRGGRAPSPEALENLRERYRLVGGRTPLLDLTRAVADRLQSVLDSEAPGRYRVYIGMKHWHPFIGEVVPQMAADGIRAAIGLVLAPHYSRASIGGYLKYIEQAQEKLAEPIALRMIESWQAHPRFRRLIADRIVETLEQFPADARDQVLVLFSAHSLPERIRTWNDPYEQELRESAAGIAGLLGLSDWRFCFQSAGMTGEPWLGPDILDYLDQLHAEGVRSVLSVPFGFVAEHLEVLWDIDSEAQTKAAELGMTLCRIRMPNADPEFVDVIGAVVTDDRPPTTDHRRPTTDDQPLTADDR